MRVKYKYRFYSAPCARGCNKSDNFKFHLYPTEYKYNNYETKSGLILCQKCIEYLEKETPDFAMGLEATDELYRKNMFYDMYMEKLNSHAIIDKRILVNTYA